MPNRRRGNVGARSFQAIALGQGSGIRYQMSGIRDQVSGIRRSYRRLRRREDVGVRGFTSPRRSAPLTFSDT
ncbi:MAG: hypothetical protein LBI62_01360 [Candidatus Accumulibacter sp.]|nr:hypothetical protein [Accumulibacter sp.]